MLVILVARFIGGFGFTLGDTQVSDVTKPGLLASTATLALPQCPFASAEGHALAAARAIFVRPDRHAVSRTASPTHDWQAPPVRRSRPARPHARYLTWRTPMLSVRRPFARLAAGFGVHRPSARGFRHAPEAAEALPAPTMRPLRHGARPPTRPAHAQPRGYWPRSSAHGARRRKSQRRHAPTPLALGRDGVRQLVTTSAAAA
jgi:hypothetical protein